MYLQVVNVIYDNERKKNNLTLFFGPDQIIKCLEISNY